MNCYGELTHISLSPAALSITAVKLFILATSNMHVVCNFMQNDITVIEMLRAEKMSPIFLAINVKTSSFTFSLKVELS